MTETESTTQELRDRIEYLEQQLEHVQDIVLHLQRTVIAIQGRQIERTPIGPPYRPDQKDVFHIPERRTMNRPFTKQQANNRPL